MSNPSGSDRARSVHAFLRERIAAGDWPVGSKIPVETELMELVGTGKSTVREAVRSLASVGMLETLPGRGTFVRARTPVRAVLADYLQEYDLSEVLDFRRTLEVQAAGLAARRRTEEGFARLREANVTNLRIGADHDRSLETGRLPGEFHALLFEATGTRLLSDTYAGVLACLRRAISRGLVVHALDGERRQQEHSEILEAIRAQDADLAAQLMSRHVFTDLTIVDSDPGDTSVS